MDKREQAYKDWQQGMKYKDIAEKYEVSESAVKMWAKRYWKNQKKESDVQQSQAIQPSQVTQQSQPKKRGAPKGNKNAVGNKGGAPKGSKNHYKHGIYEKMLFEFLTEDEKELFLQQDIDEAEECKKMIRFCDLQILKFMRKIEELDKKREKPHDLILRYNGEIEKAKKQKTKCIEVLLKYQEMEIKKGYGNNTEYDGFMEALKEESKTVWSEKNETE